MGNVLQLPFDSYRLSAARRANGLDLRHAGVCASGVQVFRRVRFSRQVDGGHARRAGRKRGRPLSRRCADDGLGRGYVGTPRLGRRGCCRSLDGVAHDGRHADSRGELGFDVALCRQNRPDAAPNDRRLPVGRLGFIRADHPDGFLARGPPMGRALSSPRSAEVLRLSRRMLLADGRATDGRHGEGDRPRRRGSALRADGGRGAGVSQGELLRAGRGAFEDLPPSADARGVRAAAGTLRRHGEGIGRRGASREHQGPRRVPADRLSRDGDDSRCADVRRQPSRRRVFAFAPGQGSELALYGAPRCNDDVGAVEQLHGREGVWPSGHEQLQPLRLRIVHGLALRRCGGDTPRPRRRLRRPLRACAAARQASRKRRGDIQDEERRHKECVALPR